MRTLVLEKAQIHFIVRDLAQLIVKDYSELYHNTGKKTLVVCNLYGSFRFCADLLTYFGEQNEWIEKVEFIKSSSCQIPGWSRNMSELHPDLGSGTIGQVLFVEDIVDSGKTVEELSKWIETFYPNMGLEYVSLLVRNTSPALSQVKYVGYILDRPNFVFGYGLDANGRFREWSNIYYRE